jgi:hypothetical protein
MKEEISIELIKLATQLTCATISQNNHRTAHKHPDKDEGSVEMIFKDCVKTIVEQFHDLTNRTD